MRIAVDCRWIFQKISGVGRYTRDLVRALLDAAQEHEFILLFNDDAVLERERPLLQLDQKPHAVAETVRYGPFSPRSTLALPTLLRTLGADVFHSTNFMQPLRRLPCAAVVTMHDLIPFVMPQYLPRSRKTRCLPLYRWITRRAARLADRVIAVSEHTKRDIVDCLGVPNEKVAVVYNGISAVFRPAADEALGRIRARFGVNGKLIVAAGRADPYKNLLGLVLAVEKLLATRRDDVTCLLIGEPDRRYPEVERYVKKRRLTRAVRFTGYLDEDDLVRAYQEADLVVHPSLYEGFGFPPLEAMACGTPVVSSSRSSLPEVLGEAALFVNPAFTDAFADVIGRALKDEELRTALRRKGLERARDFTWGRAARETLDVYRAAVDAKRR
jgi:glycosyltransferase involved in cell wall biosynthesis